MYRLLEEGETVAPTDEFYVALGDTWYACDCVEFEGALFNPKQPFPVRREIPDPEICQMPNERKQP